jgi:hypothetical protein
LLRSSHWLAVGGRDPGLRHRLPAGLVTVDDAGGMRLWLLTAMSGSLAQDQVPPLRSRLLRTSRPPRVVGHKQTSTTEVVYRRELRPVIATGAEIMDQILPQHLAPRFRYHAEQGREQCPVRPVHVRAVRLPPLQYGELVRRIKISAVSHASSRRDSRSHEVTRVIRRTTNRSSRPDGWESNSAGQRHGHDSRHAQGSNPLSSTGFPDLCSNQVTNQASGSKLTRWSGKAVADERTWGRRAKIGIVLGQEASKLVGVLSGGQKWRV